MDFEKWAEVGEERKGVCEEHAGWVAENKAVCVVMEEEWECRDG